MCCCCHSDCCCGSYSPMHYGPGWRRYHEPTPEERREYLQREKDFLEQRLKEIEATIAATGK